MATRGPPKLYGSLVRALLLRLDKRGRPFGCLMEKKKFMRKFHHDIQVKSSAKTRGALAYFWSQLRDGVVPASVRHEPQMVVVTQRVMETYKDWLVADGERRDKQRGKTLARQDLESLRQTIVERKLGLLAAIEDNTGRYRDLGEQLLVVDDFLRQHSPSDRDSPLSF